jgi:hypothetical protein
VHYDLRLLLLPRTSQDQLGVSQLMSLAHLDSENSDLNQSLRFWAFQRRGPGKSEASSSPNSLCLKRASTWVYLRSRAWRRWGSNKPFTFVRASIGAGAVAATAIGIERQGQKGSAKRQVESDLRQEPNE